jgi:3-oxoacyl-[acyl-carrier-protein] synthase-3
MSNAHIAGFGAHLPPQIRDNDWWPTATVERWRSRRGTGIMRALEPEWAGARPIELFAEAMATCRDDPFEGARQRRIIADDLHAYDLEAAAGRDALARTGIEPSAVDALLVGSSVPDAIMSTNAVQVHRMLGLPASTLSMQTEGACNAFAQQAGLARMLIATGRARTVLAIQSNTYSRTLVADDPFSAWFGDGATAAVFQPAPAGYGVIGEAHHTDGRFYASLDIGVVGQRWYDEGRCVMHLASPKLAREQMFAIAQNLIPMADRALAEAGLTRRDVTVLATHQPAAWFPAAVHRVLDLPQARRLDTFPHLASLAGANLPMVLQTCQREGQLRRDDIVLTVSGGTGMNMTVLALRWHS